MHIIIYYDTAYAYERIQQQVRESGLQMAARTITYIHRANSPVEVVNITTPRL